MRRYASWFFFAKETKMKKIKILLLVSCTVTALLSMSIPGHAHFGMIIPSDDMVTDSDDKNLSLTAMFVHPMEGTYMNMVQPARFGVLVGGQDTDLLSNLKEKKVGECSTWNITYKIKRPGDHIFYIEPQPYWEPAEDCFIIHYTKVIVNAFGMEEGWDEELGLKTEIVPLTRPYGLRTGNLFQGIVKVNGKPVPYAEVEVEYYNKDGNVTWDADPMITQVVKADPNGVFSYAMPKAGWWGFAALNEDDKKIKHDQEEKSVEIGAVLWIKTHDM
jgi:cobalt/nickel transport protein